MLPFSPEEFFALFERYNPAIWPAQIVAYGLGGLVVWAIATGQTWSWKIASFVLAAFWLWNGLAYQLAFFSPISPAAYGFAALFIVQGLIFLGSGLRTRSEPIAVEHDACTAVAACLLVYAMVIYSFIGTLIGHGWPRAPMFGVAPCPTTIFTFGVLILARRSTLWLGAIAIVWALIGSTAAVLLGVYEDLGLLVSIAALLACRRASRR
jgi:hypothetical protein